jgi:hypothetical protein
MFAIRSRAKIHDCNRRYCYKHVVHFDIRNFRFLFSLHAKCEKGLEDESRGGIAGAAQKTINSQKPDDFGWKGEARIGKANKKKKKGKQIRNYPKCTDAQGAVSATRKINLC